MYLLELANYNSDIKISLIGNSDSLVAAWLKFKSTKWDVAKLWQLGNPTCEVERNGRQVAWWY